jgi:transcription initiation protein SPT3
MASRTDKLTAKAQKITIKLPWEVTTIYSEALKQSGHQSDDEEDEDDLEAQEASLERLKVTPTQHDPNLRLKPER